MGFGLFGKLPQKRDFLALGLSRSVLEPFETWLQSAVAASRSELGAAWQEQYLVAPIWRFWIGRDVLGSQCAGAIMPSVDGVGRFFPLALLHCAEEGRAGEIAAPVFEPHGDWYAAIEDRLLTVLDQSAEIAPERLTEGLPPPPASADPDPAPRDVNKGLFWSTDGDVDALFGSVALPELAVVTAGRSYWWTRGSASAAPAIYARGALPEPFFYATMIRGTPR